MITRYDAAYYLAAPLALPLLAWRWARRGKYRQSAGGMLGRDLPRGPAAEPFRAGSVWVHAVSVGEVAAAAAIEPGLRALFPGRPLIVTTVTETGQAAARRSLPAAEAHAYFPVDLSWNVRRYLEAYRPEVIVLLEAEIWPNFLTMARRGGARIYLVNGRMSDRSFPRYRRARALLRPVFDAFAGVCVQTDTDAERFAAVGVGSARLAVTGNCKLDLEIPRLDESEKTKRKSELGIAPGRPVIVAGSTHPGEEELILDAFARVRASHAEAALILAPRHPERFDEAAALAESRGFTVRRASAAPHQGAPPSDSDAPHVVILDKMGVLAAAYGLAEVAIVAGSFGPVGGHNLLEAAAHAVPVVYGPNMKSQREIAQLFARARAGTQVPPDRLAPTLIDFLGDPDLRRREGDRCHAVLQANHGSAARAIDAIEAWESAR